MTASTILRIEFGIAAVIGLIVMVAESSAKGLGQAIAPAALSAAVAAVVMFIYLLPAWLAAKRGHHNTLAIFWLALLLGWAMIGWIAALIWALAKPAPAAAVG